MNLCKPGNGYGFFMLRQARLDAPTAVTTLTKMMESLPESAQQQAIEHLRGYVENLQDEIQWL